MSFQLNRMRSCEIWIWTPPLFFFPFAKQWIAEDILSYGSQMNQNARKVLSTDLVNTNKGYTSGTPLLLGYKCCTGVVNINVKVVVQAHECKSWQSLLRHPISAIGLDSSQAGEWSHGFGRTNWERAANYEQNSYVRIFILISIFLTLDKGCRPKVHRASK